MGFESLAQAFEPFPKVQEPKQDLFNFEEVYKLYPRKMGKKLGMDRCKRKVRTPEKYAQLKVAVENYASHCQRNKTEPQYIAHFSTFMNSWEDWIHPTQEKPIEGTKADVDMKLIASQAATKIIEVARDWRGDDPAKAAKEIGKWWPVVSASWEKNRTSLADDPKQWKIIRQKILDEIQT